MPEISASIVTYNTDEHQLLRAIGSVLCGTLPVNLVVVDNSPTNQLEEIVRGSEARYEHTQRNVGFGAGHNLAIKACWDSSEYHLVLNPDVFFGPDVVENLTEYMAANPEIGLIMPRINYPDGSLQNLCKLLPTPADLILRRFFAGKWSKLVQARTDRYEIRHADPTRIRSVPVLSGCFMFFRTEALKVAGLFDERYFMYMEDVDLCRRVHAWFDVVYYPEVTVAHEYAKGSYKSWTLTKYHIDSACRYFNKWGWIRDSERSAINNRALAQARDLGRAPRQPITPETAISG